LTAALLLLVHRPSTDKRTYFIVVLAFAFLGLVAGVLAGLSRQSAIGAVLPAVLSLVGGLAIYLIGARRADQGLVGICVIALSAGLVIGTTWGSVLRDEYENSFNSAEYKKREALIEVEVRDFRRDLGLPDTPPIAPPKTDADSRGSK
jgi:hypothetical protein